MGLHCYELTKQHYLIKLTVRVIYKITTHIASKHASVLSVTQSTRQILMSIRRLSSNFTSE